MPGRKSVRLDILPGGFHVALVHWNVMVLLGCSCSVLQGVIECYSFVAGLDNEDTIKVVRSGGEDPDGRPGDLYVTLEVSPLGLLQFSSTVDDKGMDIINLHNAIFFSRFVRILFSEERKVIFMLMLS